NVGGSVNYFPLRGSNVLQQFRAAGLYPFIGAPTFSQFGGRVAEGFSLTMSHTNLSGTIYYMTNGADPRLYGTGGTSPQAVAYSGTPLVIGQTMNVKARVLVNGTNWSALTEATFIVGSLGVPLRITEIMYNPLSGPAPGNNYEFIELMNTGPTDLQLGKYSFEGITFAFPRGYTLAAGARIVLANGANPSAFAARYPGVTVAGYFSDNLNNAGERIAIKDIASNTV